MLLSSVYCQTCFQSHAASGLTFKYRLEPVRGDGLYELLVTVGNARLSRVYALDSEGSALAPVGDWARRE